MQWKFFRSNSEMREFSGKPEVGGKIYYKYRTLEEIKILCQQNKTDTVEISKIQEDTKSNR